MFFSHFQTKTGEWGYATVEVRGKDLGMQHVPIIDVGLRDVGSSDQEFGIEVGRACFSS